MIKTIILVGNCHKFLSLWRDKTKKAERTINNKGGRPKGIIRKRNDNEILEINFYLIRNQSLTSGLTEVVDIVSKKKLRPEETLMVTHFESGFKDRIVGGAGGFYHYTKYGYLVTPKQISKRSINEFVATFFFNFEEELDRKLKDIEVSA